MGAWDDRFSAPTPERLLADLPMEVRPVAQAALAHMGKRTRVVWRGLPWRWTICDDRPSPSVFLILDPGRPLLAARLPTGFVAEHPPASFPKGAREVLIAAACVGDTVWMEWAIPNQPALDAVLGVLRSANPA